MPELWCLWGCTICIGSATLLQACLVAFSVLQLCVCCVVWVHPCCILFITCLLEHSEHAADMTCRITLECECLMQQIGRCLVD